MHMWSTMETIGRNQVALIQLFQDSAMLLFITRHCFPGNHAFCQLSGHEFSMNSLASGIDVIILLIYYSNYHLDGTYAPFLKTDDQCFLL